MIPKLLSDILTAIKSWFTEGAEIRSTLARIETEQKRQAVILDEIHAAVILEPAAKIEIVEGPPVEQP